MFSIRFEYLDRVRMETRVIAAKQYGTCEKHDGTKDILVPNEFGVDIYHSGFSRAFVMNDAGATIEKIDNRNGTVIGIAGDTGAQAA